MELARLEFPLVIADEAQALKNPGSQQSRAVRRLKGARRIALTGTPVENRLTDLWSIFDFTNPGLLGSLNEFVDFTRRLTPEDGPVNLAPLRRLTGFYILRRLKSDKSIIRDLPDKVELNRFCRLTKHQAVLYQQVVDRMRRELEAADEFQKKGVVLKSLMQFKQLCNHPAQYTGEGDFKAEESGKFLELAELAEKIAMKQEKVLVFTQFREMTDPLHELLSRVFGRPGLILARRHFDPGARPTGRGVPEGRGTAVFRVVAEGRRNRPEPDRREPCDPLRPLVESGGGESGDRPGLPDRTAPQRAGAQVHLFGHD